MAEKKIPNLDNATLIKRVTSGTFGDPCGFEEILMRTKNNRYVLVRRGGERSHCPGESIDMIMKADALEWLDIN